MPSFPNRKYVILEASEVDNVNFNEVMQGSKETLRYSREKDYFFVKFENDTPSFLEGKTTYSHYEILQILNDTNGIWYIPPIEDN